MSPPICTTVDAVRQGVAEARRRGMSIALVPTMGALHAGHASLMHQAKIENNFVVVSIFVNPTQFGPNEDLSRYPRPFEKDVTLCGEEGVGLIFHPSPQTIYPPGFKTFVEVHELQEPLCGQSRPGHFRGVATVVLKLFNIVLPDVAYFGQKDAQQTRVLQQMVRDLDVPVRLKVCPTVREADGLALSSRNQYLDAEQRKSAVVLHEVLQAISQRIDAGERSAEALQKLATARIDQTPGARLDYASIVDLETLKPTERLCGGILVALAVYFGATRLIDNSIVNVGS